MDVSGVVTPMPSGGLVFPETPSPHAAPPEDLVFPVTPSPHAAPPEEGGFSPFTPCTPTQEDEALF